MNLLKKDFFFEDVNRLKGVGIQLSRYLKKKKIETSSKEQSSCSTKTTFEKRCVCKSLYNNSKETKFSSP